MRDFQLVVDPMHACLVDYGEGMVSKAVGNQGAIGRDHMEPLGKEQVDLLDMLLQRRIARRIVLYVVRRPQSFAGVHYDVRRILGGLPVRGAWLFLVRL